MKTLSLLAVKYAALLLIETNGETSSLAVKNHLRDLGYHATQAEVSELLARAADELPLVWAWAVDPNYYRVYTLPTPKQVVDDIDEVEDDDDDTVNQFIKSYSYTKRDGSVVTGKDNHPGALGNDPHWVVYSPKSVKELVFSDAYTRDEVRFAYAKIVGVHHHDTRAVFEG